MEIVAGIIVGLILVYAYKQITRKRTGTKTGSAGGASPRKERLK